MAREPLQRVGQLLAPQRFPARPRIALPASGPVAWPVAWPRLGPAAGPKASASQRRSSAVGAPRQAS